MTKSKTRTQKIIILLVILSVTALMLILSLYSHWSVVAPRQSQQSSKNTVNINTQKSFMSVTQIGATYEQHGFEYSSDTQTKQQAEKVIHDSLSFQRRHAIGFGAMSLWTDPRERNPEKWNWQWLDQKVNEMRTSSGNGGAEIQLNLGMAPNWMTTGNGLTSEDGRVLTNAYSSPSQYPDINNDGVIDKYTDNPAIDKDTLTTAEIEAAPDDWFIDDFAYMSAAVAARYPDIKTFDVWNELKGMYNQSKNRWDYERYTKLYNAVYSAVKQVRPDARIGGPYLQLSVWSTQNPGSHPTTRSECRGSWGILDERDIGNQTSSSDSVYSYWLTHKVGADFISVDFSTKPNKASDSPYDASNSDALISDVKQCLQSIKNTSGSVIATASSLPLTISEFYPVVPNDISPAKQLSVTAQLLGSVIEHRYSDVALWGVVSENCDPISAQSTLRLFSNPYQTNCQNDALRGKPTQLAPLLKNVKDHFSSGKKLHLAKYDRNRLYILAAGDMVMIVNRQSNTQTFTLGTCRDHTLAADQVLFIDPKTCSIR